MNQSEPGPEALHALAALFRLENPYLEGKVSEATYWAAYEAARIHFGDDGLDFSANYFTDSHSSGQEISAVADAADHLQQLARAMIAATQHPGETGSTSSAHQ